MDYEYEEEHLDTSDYIGSCDVCGANVYIDGSTDNQVGRCHSCGHHPNDEQFHANPFVPLDFNED